LAKLGATPTRKCIDCGLHSEDLTLFAQGVNAKYGRRNLCYPCYTRRNKENAKLKDWKTDHQTKKRYGIDAGTYKRLMATSDCCQICGKTEELCYDHCHDTMKFRGVLCRGCNRSLGQLGDNIEGVQKVLDYLKKSELSKDK
jgi:Recombination endonuclease VII